MFALPPELFLHILDHICTPAHDLNALKAFSLVSRSWHDVAEERIFKSVRADPCISERDLPDLIAFLDLRPHIRSYVSQLIFSPLSVRYSTYDDYYLQCGARYDVQVEDVRDLIKRLPRLQTLEVEFGLLSLDNDEGRSGILDHAASISTSPALFFTLKNLVLSDCTVNYSDVACGPWSLLSALLSTFAAIDTLSITNLDLVPSWRGDRRTLGPSDTTVEPLDHLRIGTLELADISVDMLDSNVLGSLAHTLRMDRVTSLRFTDVNEHDDILYSWSVGYDQYHQTILDTMPKLTSLETCYPLWSSPPKINLNEYRDIQSLALTCLWSVGAKTCMDWGNFYHSWSDMVTLIASLPEASPLATLRLNFLVCRQSIRPEALEYVSRLGWGTLGVALERFGRLETVDTRVAMSNAWTPHNGRNVWVREAYVLEFFHLALKDLCLPERRYRTTICFVDDQWKQPTKHIMIAYP